MTTLGNVSTKTLDKVPGFPHLFRHKISSRTHSKSYLGTSWGPSYEYMYKNIYVVKVELGDNHG